MPHKTLEAQREYRENNREKIRALKRKWREENTDKVREMKRRHYARHRESILAKMKALYESDPKAWYARVREWKARNPEKEKGYQEKWAEENRESILARNRRVVNAKYVANPDEYRARSVAFYRKNKEKLRIKRKSVSVHRAAMLRQYANQRSDTIRLGSDPKENGQIVELIFQLKASPETKCFYCGDSLFGKAIHIDHIVPLSKGGAHCVSNLCASCPPCNLSKNDKTVDEWNQWKQNVESKALVRKES